MKNSVLMETNLAKKLISLSEGLPTFANLKFKVYNFCIFGSITFVYQGLLVIL